MPPRSTTERRPTNAAPAASSSNLWPARTRLLLRLALLVTVAVLAPVLTTLVVAAPAVAIDDGTLGIRPELESDFFHINLAPGAAIEANAIVSNHTDAPVTLLNYAVDGQSTEQGAFALAAQADAQTAVGSWVTLGAGSITIPADSDLTVPFRLSVPLTATPGDYAGGIIIQSPPIQGDTTTSDGDAALRLDVIQRQGVRIYLTVAGTATTQLDHGALSWERSGDAVTFTLPIHNIGNTILYPTAGLSLNSVIGATTELQFGAPESILPGSTLNLEATLPQAAFIQLGSADAQLVSDAGTQQISASFTYVPWWIIGIILLLVLAIAFAVWRVTLFVGRARRALAQVARAVPAAPNDLRDHAGNDTADPADLDTDAPLRRPRR
ncbi:WxL protein peptidoglycan domain-containing protein [Cryobacterium sp. Hb1]|uniref:WxL protein peptidoglycan domain-containing protein n=1 Tax=Cryobacterium sp. Hb1 TaxID=1259147 RepID=UPI00106B6897|nr:DUF916 domain-containing protein [Cryobacterium sp. Hb1]TFD64568.1 DUF916 domain-containing protein [Cryobacterium sp. Hb1]